MAELGFPAGPDDLGPGWFTAALRSTRTIGDHVEVTSVHAEPIGIGIGVLALLWRVRITYDRPGAGPPSVVLKLPHTGAESRHLAGAFRFYEREVRFYEEGADRSPLRTPARYASAYDEGSGDFVLVIEDLGDRRVYDQLEGCPPDAAARTVRALGSHHAAWWESPDLARPWVMRVADPPNPQALVPALRQSWPIIEGRFASVLRGPVFETARRMPEVTVALMERLSEPPLTLLHGDPRLDNLFFSDDVEGDDGVAFVDWQITGSGRGPYDVAYFLSQSLVPRVRKETERDLLAAYYQALLDGGVEGYSFEDCWEDYRLATLFVLVYPLNAGSVDLVNHRAVALFTAMLERAVAAIIDLDALELMPT